MTTGTTYSQNPVSDEGFNLDVGKITRVVSTVSKDPENGWPEVQNEYGTIKSLFLNFILPLTILAALCGFIKSSVLGFTMPGTVITYRTPMGAAFTVMIIQVIMQAVMMYVAAFILTKLAPSFNGSTTVLRTLRLMAFAYGLSWIASVATLIPYVGWVIALAAAIYGIYLFYKGVPTMTSVPKEKSLIYTVVGIVFIFITNFVIGVVIAGVGGAAVVGMS